MGKSKETTSKKDKETDTSIVPNSAEHMAEEEGNPGTNPTWHTIVQVPGEGTVNLENNEDMGESSTLAADKGDEAPSTAEMWKMFKDMRRKVKTMAKAVAPPVTTTVEESEVPATCLLGRPPAVVNPPIIEIKSTEPRTMKRKVDYLEQVTRLGTRSFKGSASSIEADEKRSRLERNFNSTRCPEDYKKDIAIHFLEGDAHNWWIPTEKRMGDRIVSFADFVVEFNKKYFLAEAWDKLEADFLDLVQWNRIVQSTMRNSIA